MLANAPAVAPQSSAAAAHEVSLRSWASIRSLITCELQAFEKHLLRLSRSCRRSRFGNETTDAFLKGYAARVNPTNTLLLGYFEAGEMRGAAELRSLTDAWGEEAEAAFSVEKPWQLRGVGTALMAGLVREAYRRGTEHIHLSCHLHNRPMQRIAEKVAAEIRLEEDDCLAHITVRRVPSEIWRASGVGRNCPPMASVVMDS